MEIEVASNSLKLEVRVPSDVPAKSLPMPAGLDWKVHVVNLDDESWQAEQSTGLHEGEGCEITSGCWQIQYVYWPSSFVYGAAISVSAWLGWSLCWVVLLFVGSRRQLCLRPK